MRMIGKYWFPPTPLAIARNPKPIEVHIPWWGWLVLGVWALACLYAGTAWVILRIWLGQHAEELSWCAAVGKELFLRLR